MLQDNGSNELKGVRVAGSAKQTEQPEHAQNPNNPEIGGKQCEVKRRKYTTIARANRF